VLSVQLSKRNDTAVVLFSRSSYEESYAKRFIKRRRNRLNHQVAKQLITRAKDIAHHSGLPLICWDETKQKGNSFGERLSHAIESCFNDGFEKLIIIGNDCLRLSHLHIQRAEKSLLTQDTVLAPTKRGGIYLIALNRTAFNTNDYCTAKWQTTEIYSDLQKRTSARPVPQLPVLNDINCSNDIQRELKLTPINDLVRKLACLVSSCFPSVSRKWICPSTADKPFFFRLTAPPPVLVAL
jgi:uncharacterized protein